MKKFVNTFFAALVAVMVSFAAQAAEVKILPGKSVTMLRIYMMQNSENDKLVQFNPSLLFGGNDAELRPYQRVGKDNFSKSESLRREFEAAYVQSFREKGYEVIVADSSPEAFAEAYKNDSVIISLGFMFGTSERTQGMIRAQSAIVLTDKPLDEILKGKMLFYPGFSYSIAGEKAPADWKTQAPKLAESILKQIQGASILPTARRETPQQQAALL